MASKARFGRLPRSSPSLTATIVALAQEYQRVRESNIVDAWKNGGEFEGKPVHDKDILAWMKARRDEISPGDPKWDYYDNQVREYQFAIANSKMELQYKRKDATDMEMAAFYHSWANKLPTDSEAYREREKLAAGYEDRANAAGSAGRRAAADRAYTASINADIAGESAYNQTLTFLEEEAHNQGIILKEENLGNIDPSTADGHRIMQLWDDIAHSPAYAGKRREMTAKIRALGGGTVTDFSQDAFNGYTRTKNAHVNHRIATAKKAGRKEDTNNFTKEKDGIRQVKIVSGGWDETSMYEDAREQWLTTINDPTATPFEIENANAKYTGQLGQIRDRLASQLHAGEHDDRLGAVNNELLTMAGDEHPYQHWGGLFGPTPQEGNADATDTAISIKRNKQNIKDLTWRDPVTGQPAFVMMKTGDKAGTPTSTTPRDNDGKKWTVVPKDMVDPNAIYIVQNDGGDPRGGQIITAIMPTPIFAQRLVDDGLGNTKMTKTEKPVAYQYTYPDKKIGYKFQDNTGKWLFTAYNPFGTETTDPNGSNVVTHYNTSVENGVGLITLPGTTFSTQPPAISEYTKPSYAKSRTNEAMPSSIGKSGYANWLIASDPKDNAAFTQNSQQIMDALKAEVGTGPDSVARLAELVADADGHRAVYLGNSSTEQQRARNNFLLGIPNPVPLAAQLPKGTVGAETRMQSQIGLGAGATRDTVVTDLREANRLGGNAPLSVAPDFSATMARKFNMPTTPVNPFAGANGTLSPTSLGSGIGTQIASTLTGIIAAATGTQGTGTPRAPSALPAAQQLARPAGAKPPPAVTPPPPTVVPKPTTITAAPSVKPTTNTGVTTGGGLAIFQTAPSVSPAHDLNGNRTSSSRYRSTAF